MVTYEDFAALEFRVGLIRSAERVPETDKLIKCTIDFGPEIGERTIVSGIAAWITPESLVGKKLPYIVNLEPRVIKGIESQGMLLALSYDERLSLLVPENTDVPPGTRIK